MLVACWSCKGGAGTTVVAAALALAHGSAGALLADLAGDLPVVLGLDDHGGPGLAGWLAAGSGVPADALARLERPVRPGLALLDRGAGPLVAERAAVLGSLLAADDRLVVADCGTSPGPPAAAVVAAAQRSLLVTRPCFVALHRARRLDFGPSGVVLVAEPGRSLGRREVEVHLGVPVVAVVEHDPAVARAVDAGLLQARLPRSLARELRDVA
jgi:MinD superfamily P-loop ATPase